MENYWYMTWADRTKSPSQSSLDKWNIDLWVDRKAIDLQQAAADVNMTMSITETEDDPMLRRVQSIESRALEHLIGRFDVEVQPIPSYVPRMVDFNWVSDRYAELLRQRKIFSTMAYWKRPPGNKKVLNQATQILQFGIRQYEVMSATDWKGVVDAFNEYVRQLEFYQMVMATARFHGVWNEEMAKVHIKVRRELRNIHGDCLRLADEKFKTAIIRPWTIDEDPVDILTQKKLDRLEPKHWVPTEDKNMTGPPRMSDGPIYDLVRDSTFFEICILRRQDIGEMVSEYRSARFILIKNLCRREKSVWGRALQSLAQYKRWGVEE